MLFFASHSCILAYIPNLSVALKQNSIAEANTLYSVIYVRLKYGSFSNSGMWAINLLVVLDI
jgi:hypothetical protein